MAIDMALAECLSAAASGAVDAMGGGRTIINYKLGSREAAGISTFLSDNWKLNGRTNIMSKLKLFGAAAVVVATAFVAGQASAFTGTSVSAADCSYGGKIKSIEATDRLNVKFTLCKPDPAFSAKAAFTPFGI
jgi:hypothetical protein